MSSRLMTALLGSAIIAGSVSGVAFAQDSTTKVKPCLGELCPPKAPREDMPKQTMEGANPSQQVQVEDQSSDQVTPRKKKQVGLHRNRHQDRPSKNTASRFDFGRDSHPQPWLSHRQSLSHEQR